MHPEQSAWLHSSFIASGENFFKGHRLSAFANFPNALDRPLDPLPVYLSLGNDAGHPFAVAGDEDAFSPLDVVEDFEEARFGIGCLNRLHKLKSNMGSVK